ncbi:DUF3311 domain-containing protein [Alicyclobacillus cycloheptanicus]|uniref:Membrane protein YhdT n=1 Tax=Alicyclobacillus cycloheptanicus TaxID=1457 RepID=A0ABT9XJE8_9BACL|nr:DUF3311 domain-containing protein [Alicyclobacillus cycloheptanicus]MDQ0189841.1 putative membrane protein YhdT [Alicyclobacillus cycloheptanicus]WDM02474.1 DUF3311 domain-containing protein [Alicyclobacillus cycloheptanicus]
MKKGSKWWYVLALIPLIGTLFPSFYSSVTPTLWGVPFFYWYQMMWVIISAILTAIMYAALKNN